MRSWTKAAAKYNLSVIAPRCHCPGCGSQRLLRCRSHPAGRGPNSSSLFPPLAAVVAIAPSRGGFGSPRKVNGFARGSPTRGAVERSETERLYEGKPDRKPLLDSTSPSRLRRATSPTRGGGTKCRRGWTKAGLRCISVLFYLQKSGHQSRIITYVS